jgi:hypothetical protein
MARPKRDLEQPLVKKKRGIWVYHGKPFHDSIVELIDREREARISELADFATRPRIS